MPKACIIIPYIGVNAIYTSEHAKSKTSTIASVRLQIRPLINALELQNYQVVEVSLNKNFQLSELKQFEKFDLCFISKTRAGPSVDENLFSQFHTCCALFLKRNGSKLITLYSDNLANIPSPEGELYKNLLYLSERIITPSEKLKVLAQSISKFPTKISVIEDPSLLKRKKFKPIKKGEPIRMIWFGNLCNLSYLTDILNNLIEKSNPALRYELNILTQDTGDNLIKHYFKNLHLPRYWNIILTAWDANDQPNQLEQALANANISLLPSNSSDPAKCGVSHNRLVDSIQSGCITLASPLSSYLELSKLCLIGSDLSTLLNIAVNENERLCVKYTQSREKLLRRFDPEINLQKWINIIDEVSAKANMPL